MANILKEEFGTQGYSIVTTVAPDFFFKIAAYFYSPLKNVTHRLGKVMTVDTTRMRTILHIDPPIPLRDSILSMAYSLIERGFVERTAQYQLNKEIQLE